MAAISAARMGSDVLLFEESNHLGGIVTNGLTMADIIKRNAVGGYNSEPHAAEKFFHQMIDAEVGIKTLYNHRLKKALKEGNKLVGVIAEELSGNNKQKKFSAKIK